jgi:hypothetical protein
MVPAGCWENLLRWLKHTGTILMLSGIDVVRKNKKLSNARQVE